MKEGGYRETLEEWIDEIEEDPIPSSEKKALRIRLLLLLYKEKKTCWFNLDKPSQSSVSVRPTRSSQQGTK
jgi:hypothetical protein